MKKSTCIFLFLGVLGIMLPSPAAATSIIPEDISISFRDDGWSPSGRIRQMSVDDVTVTAQGKKRGIKRYLYQSDLAGMGIRGGSSRGIDGAERLVVRFNEATALSGVWITDLFGPGAGGNPRKGEMGRLVINGGEHVYYFSGRDSDPDTGEQFLAFDEEIYIDKAVFEVVRGNRNRWTRNNNFGVAGFTRSPWNAEDDPFQTFDDPTQPVVDQAPAPVPEPATLLLLATGMAGLAGWRRKKR